MYLNGMESRNTTIVSLIFNSCHSQKCGKFNSSCQLNWGSRPRSCATRHVASDQIERENFKIQYAWNWQTNKGLFYLYDALCVSQHMNEFRLDVFVGL